MALTVLRGSSSVGSEGGFELPVANVSTSDDKIAIGSATLVRSEALMHTGDIH